MTEYKMNEFDKHNFYELEKANSFIKESPIWDMEIIHYDGWKMVIAGSIDFSYYHQIELNFEDVFQMSSLFSWHIHDDRPAIEMPEADELRQLNMKFEIEQGYQLFKFNPDDYNQPFCLAAKKMTCQIGMVYYYERHGLKEGERIADWVNLQKKE